MVLAAQVVQAITIVQLRLQPGQHLVLISIVDDASVEMYCLGVEALDLIMLGRRLVKIGEEAMRGSKNPGMPTGSSVVLRDVFANPDSSITDITARTGLPQSYVSECIAKLRDDGIIDTTVDPADRRRRLARVSAEHPLTVARKGAASVDATLAQSLGRGEPTAAEVTQWLVSLAKRLEPAEHGPIRRQITATSR